MGGIITGAGRVLLIGKEMTTVFSLTKNILAVYIMISGSTMRGSGIMNITGITANGGIVELLECLSSASWRTKYLRNLCLVVYNNR